MTDHTNESSRLFGILRRFAWIVVAFRLSVVDGFEILRAHSINDYGAFHFAGFALSEGVSPYDVDTFARIAREGGMPTVNPYLYPPFLAWLLAPLSYLKLWPARLVWGLLSIACFVWIFRAIDSWLKQTSTPAARALFAVATTCFWPIRETQWLGQSNAFVLACIVAWWLCRAKEGNRSAGIWLGIAIAIKMSPILLVALPLIRKQWREAAIAAGVGIGLIAVSCLAMGSNAMDFPSKVLLSFLPGHQWHTLHVPIDIYGNHSLAALSFALTGPHLGNHLSLSRGATVLHLTLAGTLLLAWIWRARKISDDAALASLLLLMVIAPTYAYEHHIVYAMVALAVVCRGLIEKEIAPGWAITLGVMGAVTAERVGALVAPPELGKFAGHVSKMPKLAVMLVAFGAILMKRKGYEQRQPQGGGAPP